MGGFLEKVDNLEKEINPRYIQKLLGHKSSKTTEFYTCVNKENFAKIENPFGKLMKEKGV